MKRRTFLSSAAGIGLLTAEESSAAPLFTFGLITDIQYADADANGERHYRSSLEKTKQLVPWLNQAKPAFTLHLGDLIDRDFASFRTILAPLETLSHPLHHLLGNHEFDVKEPDKARVVSTLKMPHDYYALYHSGWRILMLDTNALSVYKEKSDSPVTSEAKKRLKQMQEAKAPNAVAYGGGTGATQLAWLERELEAATLAGESVLCCGHHPLLPADAHQLWNSHEVLALFERYPCVKAWFNGHNHKGDYAQHQGIHCLTFRSVLHQPDTTAAAIVRVFPDHLSIEGKGRELSRRLDLR
jgi:manganese-dependent ADP-ribose/CDP-alcohol diphosphatase